MRHFMRTRAPMQSAMDFALSVLEKFKPPATGQGIERAEVVDNKDPLKIGRVKVRILSVHGSSRDSASDEDLPWASPNLFSASYNSGSYLIPEVGNTVWVGFENGNPDKPVYIGGCYGTGVQNAKSVKNTGGEERYQKLGQNERPTEVKSVDDRVIYKSPKGSSIIIREEKGSERMEIRDQLGQMITLATPFKKDKDVSRLEEMDKFDVLDGNASIDIKSINGSKINITSNQDNAVATVEMNGANNVKAVFNTKEGTVDVFTKKYDLSGAEKIVLHTSGATVTLNGSQITLSASSIVVNGDGGAIEIGGGTVTVSASSQIRLDAPVTRIKNARRW